MTRLAPTRTGGAEGHSVTLDHSPDLALAAGTLSLSFQADRLPGQYAPISKDSYGRNPGDFTLWLKDGRLYLSVEHADGAKWLRAHDVTLTAGEVHHAAISFGSMGRWWRRSRPSPKA